MVMARLDILELGRLGDTLTFLLVLDLTKYIQGIITDASLRNI